MPERRPVVRTQNLQALLEEQKIIHGRQDRRIRDWRELRRDNVPVYIPPEYRYTVEPVRLDLPQQWVRNAVSILADRMFRIRAPAPIDATDRDLEAAARREMWLAAGWKQMQRQQDQQIFRQLMDYVVADGQGWLKVVWKPQLWEGMPRATRRLREDLDRNEVKAQDVEEYLRAVRRFERSAPWPFAVRTCDPLSVYAIRGEFGIEAVIEETRRPWSQLQRLITGYHGEPIAADGPTLQEELTVVEYWDKQWHVVATSTDGGLQPLSVKRNPYGFVPFVHVPGWETSMTSSGERYLSVLKPVEKLVPLIYRHLTMKDSRSFLQSFPSWQIEGEPPAEDPADMDLERPSAFRFKVGMVQPTEQGTRGITPIPIPQVSGDLEEMFSVLQGTAESSQVNPAAVGSVGGHSGSGYAQALQAGLARVPFGMIAENTAWGIAQALQMILRITNELIRAPVTVRYSDQRGYAWVSLGPADILDDYNLDVVIKPHDPLAKFARESHYSNLWKQGFLPRLTAYELAEMDHPERLIDLSAWERVLESPQMDAWLQQAMFARLGLLTPDLIPSAPPDGMGPSQAGSLGGRQRGIPQLPGVGAPSQGPPNQPGPLQVQADTQA